MSDIIIGAKGKDAFVLLKTSMPRHCFDAWRNRMFQCGFRFTTVAGCYKGMSGSFANLHQALDFLLAQGNVSLTELGAAEISALSSFTGKERLLGLPVIATPRTSRTESPMVGEMAPILRMLSAAESKAWPRVTVATPTGRHVMIAMAPLNTWSSGRAMVSDGAPYFERAVYGVIDKDGTPERLFDPKVLAAVRQLVSAPAEALRSFGALTGKCCFCKRGLVDPASLERGYGPDCEKAYKLPFSITPAPLTSTPSGAPT